MKKSDFYNLKYFSYEEVLRYYRNANDPDKEIAKIDYRLFVCLNRFRRLIGAPVLINSLTGGLHSKNSYHYIGKAVDIRTKSRLAPHRQLQFAIDAGFRGIGYYPYWRPKWGLHLDIRENAALWKRLERGGPYLPIIAR